MKINNNNDALHFCSAATGLMRTVSYMRTYNNSYTLRKTP